jgi:hypothetical protein
MTSFDALMAILDTACGVAASFWQGWIDAGWGGSGESDWFAQNDQHPSRAIGK